MDNPSGVIRIFIFQGNIYVTGVVITLCARELDTISEDNLRRITVRMKPFRWINSVTRHPFLVEQNRATKYENVWWIITTIALISRGFDYKLKKKNTIMRLFTLDKICSSWVTFLLGFAPGTDNANIRTYFRARISHCRHIITNRCKAKWTKTRATWVYTYPIYSPDWDFCFGLAIHSFGFLWLWAGLPCSVKRFCHVPLRLRSKAVPNKPLSKSFCHLE